MTIPQLHFYNMAADIVAFSTTRQGGFSTGHYAAFNINRYCGDSEAHVAMNRRALCQQLAISDERLVMPHQTHETHVLRIDQTFFNMTAAERQVALEGIDALTTDMRCVCVGVSTADCIPVLLYDSEHHAVAAIHAGWRGTVQRIVMKAVETMTAQYGTRPEQLLAQIGPGISMQSFEVGDEVYETFRNAGFDMLPISRRYPVANSPQTEKWHIDLPACNRLQLLEAGVVSAAVSVSPICTFVNPDTFFSARRLGIQSGRIFTAIMLRHS